MVWNEAATQIINLISGKMAAGLIFLFLVFLLLYGIFAKLLSKTLDKGTPSKSTKGAALAIAGIVVLSLFYGLSQAQFFQRIQGIAGAISTVFGIVVGFFVFVLFRFGLFKDEEKKREDLWGIGLRDIMSILGAACALWAAGVIGDNGTLLAFGIILFMISAIVFIMALVSGFGGEGKRNIHQDCLNDFNKLSSRHKSISDKYKRNKSRMDAKDCTEFDSKEGEYNAKSKEVENKIKKKYYLAKSEPEKANKILDDITDKLNELNKLLDELESILPRK